MTSLGRWQPNYRVICYYQHKDGNIETDAYDCWTSLGAEAWADEQCNNGAMYCDICALDEDGNVDINIIKTISRG